MQNVTSVSWVVVEDSVYPRGLEVDSAKQRVLRARGGVALPCSSALLRMGAVSGFAVVDLGYGALMGEFPGPRARVAVRSTGRECWVAWAAKLVPGETMLPLLREGRQRAQGALRVIADGSVANTIASLGSAPATPFDYSGEPKGDGWIIEGLGEANFQGEGHYGLQLHGQGSQGLRVKWFAVTIVERV
jgi:hypothetical protein